mgnify:CR=1 FL=1
MKIVSFNINGLRARPHQLAALIEKHQQQDRTLAENGADRSLQPSIQRQQQRLDVRLGQFALAVERQLAQQSPASRQGQGFAMLAQVLAQGVGYEIGRAHV